MMKHEFYYTSRDSVTKIHAIEWLPDREIKVFYRYVMEWWSVLTVMMNLQDIWQSVDSV